MKRPAFTLVELLVVIAIIGLLSTVAVVAMSGSRDKARIAAGQSFEQSIHNAAGDEALLQWDFDDCTGTGIAATSVIDVSGNGNNGTPTGSPQWSSDTPGSRGCSLAFSGAGGQYVASTKSITSLASNSFTVLMWAKRLSPNRDDYYFSLGTPLGSQYIVIGYRSSNTFACAFFGNDLDTAATYTDSNWHLWTCAYDASANKRTLYRDGTIVGSDTPSNPFLGSGVLELGHYGTFLGNLDDVRIYGKALTAQAIQKYFAETKPDHPDSLAAQNRKTPF